MDDPKVLAGLIGAIATVVGATLGALAKGYISRQKINEMRFDYESRLADGYLEKARDYLNSVYVPLSIAVTKLNSAFISFRAKQDIQAEQIRFIASIKEFINTVDELGSKGANAFYTTDLDEALQSFREFISSSNAAEETNIKSVFKVRVGSLFPFIGPLETERENILRGNNAKQLRTNSELSLNFWKFGFSYKASEVLSAPLDSEDFEKRFVSDIHTINILVKEVTLGSKARSRQQ